MTTTIQKRMGNTRSSATNSFSDSGIFAARLQNFVREVAEDVRAGNTPIAPESMAETDAVFTVDAILQFLMNRAVNSETKEKKRQRRRLLSKAMFLDTLEKDGGIYSSAKAAEILGKTKTTVKNWKDAGQLLALEIDGEFYYPAFQFTDDESISDKGVLRGVAELLGLLKEQGFSDRMQYSFFMEERNTVLNGLSTTGRPYTVAGILKSRPDPALMDELHRLARVYGSQDAI